MWQWRKNEVWRQIVRLMKADLYACLSLWLILAVPVVCQHGPMPLLFPQVHETLHAGHAEPVTLAPHGWTGTALAPSASGMTIQHSFAHPVTPGDLFLSDFGLPYPITPFQPAVQVSTGWQRTLSAGVEPLLPPLERPPDSMPLA